MRRLKLMTDYHCFPLWGVDRDAIGCIDPADLPLSAATQARLMRWQASYDATLNQADPNASGFATPEEAAGFEREGLALWFAVRQELGNAYTVWFFSQQLGRVVTHPDELPVRAEADHQG